MNTRNYMSMSFDELTELANQAREVLDLIEKERNRRAQEERVNYQTILRRLIREITDKGYQVDVWSDVGGCIIDGVDFEHGTIGIEVNEAS